jgi:hypothetical protein
VGYCQNTRQRTLAANHNNDLAITHIIV